MYSVSLAPKEPAPTYYPISIPRRNWRRNSNKNQPRKISTFVSKQGRSVMSFAPTLNQLSGFW